MKHSPFRPLCLRALALPTLAAAAFLATPVARADAPAGRYTIESGEVTDHKTGLVWRQRTLKGNYGAAISGCSSPWRVPSVRELASLVDPRKNSPAIDETAFPETKSERYWTSETMFGGQPGATRWVVNFDDGKPSVVSVQTTTMHNYRCVKTAPAD